MIIGEVKEGAARFNAAMRDPDVLLAAIVRFGCCTAQTSRDVVERLLSHGRATTPYGHHVRMIAFGTTGGEGRVLPGQHIVDIRHVIRFLQRHIVDHRAVMRAAETHDPVLAFLTLLDKAGFGVST